MIVRDFEFDPSTLFIAAGDTVCWIWESGFHTVTSGASSFPGHNPGAYFDELMTSTDTLFCKVFDDTDRDHQLFLHPARSTEHAGDCSCRCADLGVCPMRCRRIFACWLPSQILREESPHFRLHMAQGSHVRADVFDVQGKTRVCAGRPHFPRRGAHSTLGGRNHPRSQSGSRYLLCSHYSRARVGHSQGLPGPRRAPSLAFGCTKQLPWPNRLNFVLRLNLGLRQWALF